MESMKFDEDIIRNQNLVFVDQVNNDWICTICKKIQYNAYTAPCAHGFCKTCIGHHLAVSSVKICTGDENECKEIDLEMDSNVHRCPRTNKRIENIRVKCINTTCEKIVRLKEMKEHLNTCENKNTNCPYTFIGCSSGLMTEKDIRKHLLDESIIHADLFSETIKRVYDLINEQKQEINNINQEIETVRNGNLCLTGRIENIESRLQEYFGIIGNLNSDNNGIKEELSQIKEENKRHSDEIKVLKDEMKQQKEINKRYNNKIEILKDENKQQKEINRRYNDEIKVLKDENKQKEINKNMSEEMNTLKEFSKQISEEIQLMKNKNKDLENTVSLLTTTDRSKERNMKVLHEDLQPRNAQIENKKSIYLSLVPAQYNVEEFEVNIEDFLNKIKLLNQGEEKEIYKFDRYLNGYKIYFKLSVKRGEDCGDICYSVFIKLSVCEGEFDELLSWPCKRRIEVELIGRDGSRWGEEIFEYEEDKWRSNVVGERRRDYEKRSMIDGCLMEIYKNKILIENCLKLKIKII